MRPRTCHDAVQAGTEAALRAGLPVALVYLNIAGFRSINRQYGVDAADAILWMLGERFAAAFGESSVARLPGDEFVLVLSGAAAAGDGAAALHEVERVLAIPFARAGGSVSLSAAIGIATRAQDEADFRGLFECAETAMLEARAAGHGAARHGGAHPARQACAATAVAAQLRRALECNEFVLYYQPQVDLRTRMVVGAEALIRWAHPERGLLLPGEFIGAAEQTGMIVPIGRWVLEEACRAAARWRVRGHGDLMVAVNLSARQFEAGNLDRIVQKALDEAQLPAACLELELTETILIDDAENVLKQIRQLKQMGLTLSLDDFGTGYSSLSYLKKFSVDKIKIDRSFVSGLGKDPNDAAIVRAIVQIARSLGLCTIAEGVEDTGMLGCLQLLGCDEVQGYHFSPPLPAHAFDKMLAVLGRHATPERIPA